MEGCPHTRVKGRPGYSHLHSHQRGPRTGGRGQAPRPPARPQDWREGQAPRPPARAQRGPRTGGRGPAC